LSALEFEIDFKITESGKEFERGYSSEGWVESISNLFSFFSQVFAKTSFDFDLGVG